MTDPAREDLIGKWSLEKLELLRKYLAAYLKILTNQSWCRGYEFIDAFAGTGKPKSRDEQRYVDGSPRIALSLSPPFSQYHFVEQINWRGVRGSGLTFDLLLEGSASQGKSKNEKEKGISPILSFRTTGRSKAAGWSI